MKRRIDDAGWQQLRKDKRSLFALLPLYVTSIAATISFITLYFHGPQIENRANPLYWLLMLPMVYWLTEIATYRAKSMKLLLPGQIIIPLIAAAALYLAIQNGYEPTGWIITLGVCIAGSAISASLYRGSLLQQSVTNDPLEG